MGRGDGDEVKAASQGSEKEKTSQPLGKRGGRSPEHGTMVFSFPAGGTLNEWRPGGPMRLV